MKTRLTVLFLLLSSLLLPCLAMAADQEEPTIYIIKRGDTLWGLSERFIKDPNYWPNMWSKNDQITNPHVIYPGQKVRVFADRLEFVPIGQAPRDSAAATRSADIAQDVMEERRFSILGSEGF